METEKAPKRKYKKHKKGFKIAVEHKLYVKEKVAQYEPLYIEIRAKNQRTLVKSRFHCMIDPRDFDKLFHNDIIAQCLQTEKDLIINSVKNEVEQSGQEFSMKEWYRKYSASIDRKDLVNVYLDYMRELFTKAAYEKKVDEVLILRVIDDSDDEWELLTYMRLLYGFGFKEFEDPLELQDKIADFVHPFVSMAIHKERFIGIGYFSITDSLVGSDLKNGLFSLICSKYVDNEENTAKFKESAKAIERILRKKTLSHIITT